MSVAFNAVIMEIGSYIAWFGGYMQEKRKNDSMAGVSGVGNAPVPPENLPLEDMILKSAVTYFGEVLLPYLGIDYEVKGIAPTELVYLEVKGMIEDFTYIVSDRSWIHLEFESDKVTEKDLRRFRGYEAVTGYTYQVSVTTIVICSAKAVEILSELHEGINTYRVVPVRLKDWDADQLYDQLKQKQQAGESIDRKDVIPVLLAPLMSGNMPEKERFIEGNRLLQTSAEITADEGAKMQAVLYALAVKFLDSKDLEEVKEEFSMTLLGQMLVNDGIERGIERGIEKGRSETLRELAIEMRKNGEPYEKVSRYTRTAVETIRLWEKENECDIVRES